MGAGACEEMLKGQKEKETLFLVQEACLKFEFPFPIICLIGKMSSTVRVYVNNKRIATGKPWKGKFLQVYPEQKTYASEAEWRSAVYQSVVASIRFEVKTVEKKVEAKANPIVVPKVPVKPILNPEDEEEEEKKPVDQNWICGYCRLPPGNDHRMCICRGYNYSVIDWEKARVFAKKVEPKKEEPKPTPSKLSLNRKDWSYSKLFKTTLPAGTYYIGDLCYALDDTLYDKVFGPQYECGLFTSLANPKHVFMMGNTDDGLYRGTDGKEYPVDAGIIGIASEATLDPKKAPYDGGSLYTFTSPVSVKLKEDKFIFYGEKYTDPRLTIYIYEEDYEDSE
jgi:hypothetical protein